MVSVPKPKHQAEVPSTSSAYDWGGYFPDEQSAQTYYKDNLDSPYHLDRFRAIKELSSVVSSETKGQPLDVIDFGIGDGLDFVKLNMNVQSLVGIDISPHMLEIAQKNLEMHRAANYSALDYSLTLGDETLLGEMGSSSVDLVVATNVLGYLTEHSEQKFWLEVKRILSSNGFVLITVGNILFDLFALNAGTKEFYEKEFGIQDLDLLVSFSETERFVNARRHNPLKMQDELNEIGLTLKSVSFASHHKLPPSLLQIRDGLSPEIARLHAREFQMLAIEDIAKNRWQSWFRCSIVGLLFQKR